MYGLIGLAKYKVIISGIDKINNIAEILIDYK